LRIAGSSSTSSTDSMEICHLDVRNRQVSVRAEISITDFGGINYASCTVSGEPWLFPLPKISQISEIYLQP
jgi:hypothetical protein